MIFRKSGPWHSPGGPVGPASTWAATPNVKQVKRLFPLTGECREGGERNKVTRRVRKEGVEWEGGPWALSQGGKAPLGYSYRSLRVPSYATADGAGLPTKPGPVLSAHPPPVSGFKHVIEPFQTVAEDIFMWSLVPKRCVNSQFNCTLEILLFTYTLALLLLLLFLDQGKTPGGSKITKEKY